MRDVRWVLLCLVLATLVMPVLAVPESVAIDRGLLINSVAGYYFRVPEGWTLRDGSDHRKVTVDCGNEASMVISMENEILEPAVASPNAKWVFTEVKLGRRTGRELRLNQETVGMGVISKRYVTVADGPVNYQILATFRDASGMARGQDLDRIFGSFGWGTPPKKAFLATEAAPGGKKGRPSMGDPVPARISKDRTYGYTEWNPIRVGQMGGAAYAGTEFMKALRGPKGEALQYRSLGSCCYFETPNGPIAGKGGFLERYEVTYDGLEKPIVLYFDVYDYVRPLVPMGLSKAR